MLKIDNLHATVGGTQILNGLTLEVGAGEVHAMMGPNGAGKSTLAYVLGGRPGYEVTGGSVTFASPLPLAGGDGGGPESRTDPPLTPPASGRGTDLLSLEPHERAALGPFQGFQCPVGLPGVSFGRSLRRAWTAQRNAHGKDPRQRGT